jgi:lysophospholipase L1-like esterase
VPDNASRPVYVALGDSISIDDYSGGPGCGGASLLFANRSDDFPRWRGRDLASGHPDARFALLATDGATTRTMLDVQLPRLAASGAQPTIATVTIGGNDVLSAYGDTPASLDAVRGVARGLTRALGELEPVVAAGGRLVSARCTTPATVRATQPFSDFPRGPTRFA